MSLAACGLLPDVILKPHTLPNRPTGVRKALDGSAGQTENGEKKYDDLAQAGWRGQDGGEHLRRFPTPSGLAYACAA